MATVVMVMDRATFAANTDNIVVVDPELTVLTWVPRDLWCEAIRDRANRAFAIGGHGAIVEALAEHGFEVEHSICISRRAAELGLEGVTITMPIRKRLEFWYPIEPTGAIREARKRVVFEPPIERLSGERIHQWIGARRRVEGGGSDLGRIRRQQELLAVMLGDGFDFGRFLHSPSEVKVSGREAIEELSRVDARWRMEIVRGLEPTRLDGKLVLVPKRR